MASFQTEISSVGLNPIDLIEEIVRSNEWAFERTNQDQLSFEVMGRWGQSVITFFWNDDSDALMLTTELGIGPTGNPPPVEMLYQVLALVNERIGFGCFLLLREELTLSYRFATLWRSIQDSAIERIEDMIDIAVGECERFFPVFHAVVHHHSDPDRVIETALCETVANA